VAKIVKVLVVDDHEVIRAGIARILSAETDIKIVGEARDGQEAINRAVELKPDVILMDIIMPQCSGLEALPVIKDKVPSAKVLILTVSESEDDLFQAIKFGADGYLLKGAAINDIVEGIRQVAEGLAIVSPYMAGKLLQEFRKERLADVQLSPREMEVLALVGEGLTNREVAEQLTVTEGSVKTYLQRILQKLHLSNRAEARAYALRECPVGPKTRR
jgi:DNA-binding NarL/FixJ family response regulator